MHASLSSNQFFVKEHAGLFKASNNYDIVDPGSGRTVLECREPRLGLFAKLFRFSDYKTMTPFDIEIRTPDGQPVLTVRRGLSIGFSKVEVLDENGQLVGRFKPRLFSIGGKFDVQDPDGQPVCSLKGKWTSWEFRFLRGDTELARVTKKWAGLGKELFTSADNYMLSVNDKVAPNNQVRILIVAAVMCIDMLLKE